MNRQDLYEENERREKTRAGLSKIQAQLEEHFNLLKELKDAPKKEEEEAIQSIKDATLDIVHNENVKVYRNIQAVVVDESAKVKETADNASSKAGTAMIFAIIACGITLLHFVFDILVQAGVF